jgi:hypothetical protein
MQAIYMASYHVGVNVTSPPAHLIGWLVLAEADIKRSQRKHWLSTSVKRGGLARAIFLLAARDDSQHIVRQRSLQFEGLRRVS